LTGRPKSRAAEEFLRTDQREFGDAWRYELVDGRIVGHAAPTPLTPRLWLRFFPHSVHNRRTRLEDSPTFKVAY
jgi:hypothetical protein